MNNNNIHRVERAGAVVPLQAVFRKVTLEGKP